MMLAVSSIPRGHASRPDARAPGQQRGQHHDERRSCAVTLAVSACRPRKWSSIAYCGSSSGVEETWDRYQPVSTRCRAACPTPSASRSTRRSSPHRSATRAGKRGRATPRPATAAEVSRRRMTAGLGPGAHDAAGTGEGSAADFPRVPLLAMAAALAPNSAGKAWNVTRANASAGLSPCSRQRATADAKEPRVRRDDNIRVNISLASRPSSSPGPLGTSEVRSTPGPARSPTLTSGDSSCHHQIQEIRGQTTAPARCDGAATMRSGRRDLQLI